MVEVIDSGSCSAGLKGGGGSIGVGDDGGGSGGKQRLWPGRSTLLQHHLAQIQVERGEGLKGLDVHEVTSLVKTFLRQLPEPLLPCLFHDPLLSSMELPEDKRADAVQGLCFSMPAPNLSCLRYFVKLLAHVASHVDKNRSGKNTYTSSAL